MLKLDKRLQSILSEINCETLADIGCDHGKVSAMSLILNKANKVFAVDISEKSLQKVRALKDVYRLKQLIPVAGDGLLTICDPYDQVVIAGMGGNEIIKIIDSAKFFGRMVLVPHQDADILRQFLSGKVSIIKDYYTQVGSKFYPIIVTDFAVLQNGISVGDTYAKEEFSYGKNMPATQEYIKMLKERQGHYAKYVALNGVKDTKLNKYLVEVNQLCQKLKI